MEVLPTILLVEDTEDDIFFFRRALGAVDARIQLRVVENAWEARNYLEGQGVFTDRTYYPLPAVVVADLHLPGATGLQLLEWMRNQSSFQSIPVVVLSGSMRPAESEQLKLAGAVAQYTKSPNFAECQEIVRQVLSLIRKSS